MAPLQKSKSASKAEQLQIQHFTHQHVLHKIYMTVDFNCDGCNTGGCGVRYRCSVCDFDLHEKCATSPHRISSHLHPHHQLVLVNRPGDSHFCDVCRGFTNGLSYTCESPTCTFDLHPLCFQTPAANGVPSLSLDPGQQAGGVSWGQPTPAVGGHHRSNSQPVMVNHHHQMKQEMPNTAFGGHQGLDNNGHLIMINHQQHHQQQKQQQHQLHQQQQQQQPQQQQGIPATMFGGYNGMNNTQPMMVGHQQQSLQAIPEVAFGGYNGLNNSQPMMVNHQQQQRQGVPGMSFGVYNNGMNNNGMNTNQQIMIQQKQQQQGMMPMMMYGGYNGVNYNNQNMMNNNQQQQLQQHQQPGTSNNYSKVGKFAANILSTSLIGIPLFNTKN